MLVKLYDTSASVKRTPMPPALFHSITFFSLSSINKTFPS